MEVTMDILAVFKLAVDLERRLTRIIRQALYRY
jgi:hypothetical protein